MVRDRVGRQAQTHPLLVELAAPFQVGRANDRRDPVLSDHFSPPQRQAGSPAGFASRRQPSTLTHAPDPIRARARPSLVQPPLGLLLGPVYLLSHSEVDRDVLRLE